jgi:DNA-binding beta-propeller fold protein YncE
VADFGWGAQYAARDDSSPLIGTGSPGAADGNQCCAQFDNPGDIALSWGYVGSGYTTLTDRLYIADTGNHTIRRIRFRQSFEACPQPYFIETEAGVAGEAGSNDGRPDQARFNAPRGVVVAPDGSIYVADTGNHTIRRIGPDGVTTVAGLAGAPGWADGPAGVSRLDSPSGIDVGDGGELFIADSGNHVIRKVSPDGMLTTIAGTPGVAGWADGPARSALFAGPVGVRVLGRTVYVADTSNNVIRAIDLGAPPVPRRRAVQH